MATSRNAKKFLDGAGVSTLWGKILNELADKQDVIDANNKLSASNVSIADAGSLITATDVEGALQELASSIASAGSVTVEKTTGGENDSFVTRYQFKQNGVNITNGLIEIGKDMVATSGELVQPDAEHPITIDNQQVTSGTYIHMVIGNGDDFYINVLDLIEYNTFVDSSEIDFTDTNHSVTASIKSGSIAIGKLDSSVQASLGLADSALQAADIAEGATNGTISVDGTDVAVHGLGSAAYTASTAYDAAGEAVAEASAVYNAITALTLQDIEAAITEATTPSQGD